MGTFLTSYKGTFSKSRDRLNSGDRLNLGDSGGCACLGAGSLIECKASCRHLNM